ncbi:MAG: phosphate signaling complex protein PhoU [Bdellovibrio bacteriovorus]
MAEFENLVQKKRTHLNHGVHDMGTMVVDALRRSLECVGTQDLGLARQIIDNDPFINDRRRILENECLVALAAYKPAGQDLRCLGACLGLVSELERIGDYAADVARIVLRAGDARFPKVPLAAVKQVGEDAIAMLVGALAAFDCGGDEASARASVAQEEQVDAEEEAVVVQVLELMRSDPEMAALGTYLLWIVHNYERVADRATNVAERVIYIASGETEELG